MRLPGCKAARHPCSRFLFHAAQSSPTIRTLAAQLGLSRTTVSDALRSSPRVKSDTAKRVGTRPPPPGTGPILWPGP